MIIFPNEALAKAKRLQQTNITNTDWLKLQLQDITDTEAHLRKFISLNPESESAKHCQRSADLIAHELKVIRGLYHI